MAFVWHMVHSRTWSIGLRFIKRLLYRNFSETAVSLQAHRPGQDKTVRTYNMCVPSSLSTVPLRTSHAITCPEPHRKDPSAFPSESASSPPCAFTRHRITGVDGTAGVLPVNKEQVMLCKQVSPKSLWLNTQNWFLTLTTCPVQVSSGALHPEATQGGGLAEASPPHYFHDE